MECNFAEFQFCVGDEEFIVEAVSEIERELWVQSISKVVEERKHAAEVAVTSSPQVDVVPGEDTSINELTEEPIDTEEDSTELMWEVEDDEESPRRDKIAKMLHAILTEEEEIQEEIVLEDIR